MLDHGLLYGDGVFEGIRVYGGRPFLLDEHLERLEASARAIVLELPADRAAIAALCHEAAQRAGLTEGYLRLVVTRGVGALGVSPHTCPRASLIVIAAPLSLYPPERYRDGVRLVTSSLRRSAHDALPPQVKSLNYLTSVLASIEARRQGADEAVLLNAQGLIAECTADNLFLVSRGRVLTPAVASGALGGHHACPRAAPARRAGHRVGRGRAHAGRRLDGRRAVPHRHRRRDRARLRDRRTARFPPSVP